MAQNNIDFAKILGKQAAAIEKPKPMPLGSYIGMNPKMPDFTGVGQKGTPAAEFTFNVIAPNEVDQADLAAYGPVQGKQVKYSMFLSEASEYRSKQELIEAFDLEEGDKTLGQLFNETVGKSIMLHVEHQVSQDGTEIYSRVVKISKA